jgi:hypothetical protein
LQLKVHNNVQYIVLDIDIEKYCPLVSTDHHINMDLDHIYVAHIGHQQDPVDIHIDMHHQLVLDMFHYLGMD